MGRGRKKKPTAIRILEGMRGHRPIPENEPNHRAGAVCQRWLSKRVKVEWKRLASALNKDGPVHSGRSGLFCALLPDRGGSRGSQYTHHEGRPLCARWPNGQTTPRLDGAVSADDSAAPVLCNVWTGSIEPRGARTAKYYRDWRGNFSVWRPESGSGLNNCG